MSEDNKNTNKNVPNGSDENANKDDFFPENPDDIAKEKRADNEFNATNNNALNQVFAQYLKEVHLHFGNESYYNPTENTTNNSMAETESYDLRKADDCAKFGERYKGSEHFATAIILCTFEVVSLGDLPDLKSKLIELLPKEKVFDDEGKEISISQENPYLSLNSILTTIGGKLFTAKNGQRCTGFGENSQNALINIWEQFPDLHNCILSWLINISETYEYRTTFDAYQITTALVRVISLDFIDAKKRIFPLLYLNPNNEWLLGSLICMLHNEPNNRQEILPIILLWAKSDNDLLWKSACLTYYCFEGKYVYDDFQENLKNSIKKRLLIFRKNDIKFIAWILCISQNLRSNLSKILYEIFQESNERINKIKIASIYIGLIRYCYYRVNINQAELSLVACDTKEQQHNLTAIIQQIMNVYKLRQMLYNILSEYIKEVSNYDLSVQVVNHISAYFYNMALSNFELRQDLLFFLKKCEGDLAKQIYEILYKVYYSNIGG